MLTKSQTTQSGDSGKFSIAIPSGRYYALLFSHPDYYTLQRNFYLQKNELEAITIRLSATTKLLEEVVVKSDRERTEAGLIQLNARDAVLVPSSTGGVEALIKTIVGSNNELTSQYNVRGGNYDENLVYINDFEIYRPYLVSNGQQEGLSFINPAMVKSVQFFNGGYQARYGDKMSSVLDIHYKDPKIAGGSAYISLMEQGFHLEGTGLKNKFSYIVGARNKTNSSLLASQATSGSYQPSANDVQALLKYSMSAKLFIEFLGIYSQSAFTFYPEEVKKTAAVFSPLFSSNLGLDVYFEGSERDKYRTSLAGVTLVHQPLRSLSLKWMANVFEDKERENFDIGGQYLLGERDLQQNSPTYGQITTPIGNGYYQNFGRNQLRINTFSLAHKGSFSKQNHFLLWGLNFDRSVITDNISEFDYKDSSGFSLPYVPNNLTIERSLQSALNLNVNKFSGYLQDNIHLNRKHSSLVLQIGSRFHYNDLNKEFLISPRAQLSWKPLTKQDIVLKAAAGIYAQPPFYREMRDLNGNINLQVKAQKSRQFSAGADIQFKGISNRPFRLSSEAYYKQLWDVIPYDVDNVKIRYWGRNMAKAYTTGLELRLFGELTEVAESWISIGYMRSRENIERDGYTQYFNSAGEEITSTTQNKIVADSSWQSLGYLRRPNDRAITAGLYIEDYLTTNKNFKLHLNILYGSNMPYNIPGSSRYRNALKIEPYIRADIGMSVLLLTEKLLRRSYSPFRTFENIWASLEVLNAINRYNTISYQLIRDVNNNVYALPNRLTPRLLNFKLLARF